LYFVVSQEDTVELNFIEKVTEPVLPFRRSDIVIVIRVSHVSSSTLSDKWLSVPCHDKHTSVFQLVVQMLINSNAWLHLEDVVNVLFLVIFDLVRKVAPVEGVDGEVVEVIHVVVIKPLSVNGHLVNLLLSDVEPNLRSIMVALSSLVPAQTPVRCEVMSTSQHFSMENSSNGFWSCIKTLGSIANNNIYALSRSVCTRFRNSIGFDIDFSSLFIRLYPPVLCGQILVENTKPF